jgi:hypothetical protein
MTAEAFGVTTHYVHAVRSRVLRRIREENERRGNPLGPYALHWSIGGPSDHAGEAEVDPGPEGP